jgi:hypothetical protein
MAGRKRRFLLFGVVNVLLTNGALLLLLHLVTIGLATFLSQLLNLVLGYWLYGKRVFRVERFALRSAGAYGGLAASLWLLNWLGIRLLSGSPGLGSAVGGPVLRGAENPGLSPRPCCWAAVAPLSMLTRHGPGNGGRNF